MEISEMPLLFSGYFWRYQFQNWIAYSGHNTHNRQTSMARWDFF